MAMALLQAENASLRRAVHEKQPSGFGIWIGFLAPFVKRIAQCQTADSILNARKRDPAEQEASSWDHLTRKTNYLQFQVTLCKRFCRDFNGKIVKVVVCNHFNKTQSRGSAQQRNVENILHNPVGVAEHSDIMDTVEKELEIIAEGPSIVIQASEAELAKMDPYVVEMHTKSGLLEEIKKST